MVLRTNTDCKSHDVTSIGLVPDNKKALWVTIMHGFKIGGGGGN